MLRSFRKPVKTILRFWETHFSGLKATYWLMKEKAKILVVEDETAVADMMAAMLTHAGCEVQTAHRGDSGLEIAKEEKFDLITLDVDLPGLDGFEIYLELKQRHISYRTPVVFVSGFATPENLERAFKLGANDFIEKPFKLEQFISRISSCIKSKTIRIPLDAG